MQEDFELILDQCIDRLNHGDRLEDCLADYPAHAAALEPLLRAMTQAQASLPLEISDAKKRSARLRFAANLDQRQQRSLWGRLAAWQPVWMPVAAVLFVAVISFMALRTSSSPISILPGEPLPSGLPTVMVNASSPTGNFIFLVSDEENAIGDFKSLMITVSKVVLLKGNSEQLVAFVPDVTQFDLTLLPGNLTQALWQGDIAAGDYTKIYVYISTVSGVLKSTGEEISVKLPSDKLQLIQNFQVSTTTVTSFTFDITVIKTGQNRNTKYILKPQASVSGATQVPSLGEERGKGQPQP
jgi:hypothetical protein